MSIEYDFLSSQKSADENRHVIKEDLPLIFDNCSHSTQHTHLFHAHIFLRVWAFFLRFSSTRCLETEFNGWDICHMDGAQTCTTYNMRMCVCTLFIYIDRNWNEIYMQRNGIHCTLFKYSIAENHKRKHSKKRERKNSPEQKCTLHLPNDNLIWCMSCSNASHVMYTMSIIIVYRNTVRVNEWVCVRTPSMCVWVFVATAMEWCIITMNETRTDIRDVLCVHKNERSTEYVRVCVCVCLETDW